MSVLSQGFKSFRFWGSRRFGKRSEAQKRPHFVSVFDRDEASGLKAHIERAFAFSASSLRMAYSTIDVDTLPDEIIELAPSRILFVNVIPSRQQLRAIKHLDVPYLNINAQTEPKKTSSDVNSVTQRGGISEVVGRRNAIYVHKPSKRNLLIIVNAFLDAKRQYPDLLMMLSGVQHGALEALNLDLMIIDKDASKSKRQLGDVLVSPESDFSPDWAATANLCILLPENKDIQKCGNLALGSGASLLTYRVDLEPYETLNELEAIGAIWSAQNPNLLAAAITQALSPEKTALTVAQSLEHLTATEDYISQSIDALLDQE